MLNKRTPITTRPKEKVKLSGLETVLFWLPAVIVLVSGVVLAIKYQGLPQVIPSHFDATGQADDWSDKSILIWLYLGSVFLIAGLAVLARFPHLFNYPVPVTEENAPRLYKLGVNLMIWINFSLAIMAVGTIFVFLSTSFFWLTMVGVAMMMAVSGYFIVKMYGSK